MKFDLDNNKKTIVIVICILFIIFLIIKLLLGAFTSKNDNSVEVSVNTTAENSVKNTEKIKKLKKLTEGERIRSYLGEYFKYIENKDYKSAYNLLYVDFKQNYFPTLDDFKEYIEKTKYPAMLAIKYREIETQGHYYIVTLDINNLDPDAINSDAVIKEGTKFIIKENDYDEFYLSFQL